MRPTLAEPTGAPATAPRPSVDAICQTLVQAAAANDLPVERWTRRRRIRLVPSETYRLVPAAGGMFAKMDAWTAQITVFQGDIDGALSPRALVFAAGGMKADASLAIIGVWTSCPTPDVVIYLPGARDQASTQALLAKLDLVHRCKLGETPFVVASRSGTSLCR